MQGGCLRVVAAVPSICPLRQLAYSASKMAGHLELMALERLAVYSP